MSGNFARQTGMTRPVVRPLPYQDRSAPMGRLSQVTLPVSRRPTVSEVEARWDSPDVRPIRLVGHRVV